MKRKKLTINIYNVLSLKNVKIKKQNNIYERTRSFNEGFYHDDNQETKQNVEKNK